MYEDIEAPRNEVIRPNCVYGGGGGAGWHQDFNVDHLIPEPSVLTNMQGSYWKKFCEFQ